MGASLYVADDSIPYEGLSGEKKHIRSYRSIRYKVVEKAVKAWCKKLKIENSEREAIEAKKKLATERLAAAEKAKREKERIENVTAIDERRAATLLESIRSLKLRGKDKAAETLAKTLMRRFPNSKAGKEWKEEGK